MKKILAALAASLTMAGCAPVSPLAPAAPPAADLAARGHAFSADDVEYLARVLAAEARGELARYPHSVLGVGYVIARTARKEKVGVRALITQRQPWLLTSYKEGPKGINGKYFHVPVSRIDRFSELEAIAKKAIAGHDPTGIDPNHFYDDSIAHRPPAWSKGPGVKKKQLGHFIFVHNPLDR